MRKIYAIGETVLDIIFKNGVPQTAKPGGAMLNSTVSLGRIGLPVSLITEYASDNVGRLIDRFLNDNGVGTGYVSRFSDGATALALAFLNEKNDADYTFYKNYPEKRLDIGLPEISGDDIFLFGSIYAITVSVRERLKSLLRSARDNRAIVIYDPNFRSAHAAELDQLLPLIIENIKEASLVRGSNEDFRNIFGASTPDEAWKIVKEYCNCLVYTADSEGVYVRTKNFSGKFPVRSIRPVSTIGAGDNFNAGMIMSLYNNHIITDQLEMMGEDEWEEVIAAGVSFATDVCLSYENYISAAFASRYFSASRHQI